MNVHSLIFSIIGIITSLTIFLDKSLSHVCLTRGCNILRRHNHTIIISLANLLFGFINLLFITFFLIWNNTSDFIGYLSGIGTIYAIYFISYSIKKYDAQCAFSITTNVSMIMIFLIWLSDKFK